jgi:hypothetical protein
MVNSTIYQPPVDKLLTLGNQQLNYVAEFGFSSEHIPDLIKMAVDNELLGADTPELTWAPVHAWRAIGQLQATDAIVPLIQLFQLEDNDLVNEELPKVYGMIGHEAISPLAKYLASEKQLLARVTAINSLEEIANQHTDARDSIIAVLTHSLQSCSQNKSELNGFIISTLVNLKATEAAPVIKYAFNANQVAEDIVGNWDEVRESLGITSDEDIQEFQPQALPQAADINADVEIIEQLTSAVEAEVSTSTPDVEPQSEKDIAASSLLTPEVTDTETSTQEIIPKSLPDESVSSSEIEISHLAPEVETETINTEENIINDIDEAEETLEEVALEVKATPEPQVTVDDTQQAEATPEPQVTVEDILEVEVTPETQVGEETSQVEATPETQVAIEETSQVEATPDQVAVDDTQVEANEETPTQVEELHQQISQESIEPVSVDISEESDAAAQEDIKGFGRPATSKEKPEKQKVSKKKKRGFADL